ncbi:tRNA(His) guanylyltransferase Thg1 family protein (plasmid) [Bradyrhizobium elkanii]|jgi:tRNA(His) guanylyltransferase|uniref:tRNA(His) guanylyltransferase Thg1 family protein n=1 Tax=Bradyrhizobium elkanii TaxID=29448 RepID=UPI002227155D|nr:tRNA(His) guanylyltransferase Thg1 family protein [Bradyrhizobium elkanii]MCW2228071.1 tRNA(His) 5'-end guanylyltransferase [Bradyrhizobium elkanii]WLB14850.1 tRNA(His) guanylyltransferase Thg1 family protein [Bradyrhizobium elkanii]WLB69058.1 tRNA(His) guanylyltransferase Thg1 family protein [Bradyrhizobium elkanii]
MSRMSEKDDFGNRMKAYEAIETARKLDPMLPIYARIDGRSFSKFTRGMDRPFDARMTDAMIETTKHLVHETHARMGYTQSDEISLVWLADGPDSDMLFSGKLQKMTSVLASMAAAKFARVCPFGFEDRLPHFDCRAFQLPSKEEAANAFLWRAMDARKNAISMVAQSKFSHRKLHQKDQKAMLEMLAEIGVDFETFPQAFKRGSFVRRHTVERLMTTDELERIPEKHRPTGPVMRNEMRVLAMPAFNRVANRVAVIFDGAEPEHI